jgi:hypothetical protein
MPPQFGYSFACSTCAYGADKAGLLCTNMIRRGATGYLGSINPTYGHHMLNEFLDETLKNGRSIGYAFKVGKNNEARRDWATKLLSGYQYSELLNSMYGVYDILVGDPSFDGRMGT